MSNHDVMEVDVLLVGAGPANLACAIRLMQKIKESGASVQPNICIIEKGPEVGAHCLSGAVLDPIALRELLPDYKEKGCPIEKTVDEEGVYFLTQSKALKLPIIPPPMHNHGNYIVSLAKFARWLGAQAEALGVNIFAGFAGSEVLYEGHRVIGVRTGDKGVDANGEKRANFEPGIDLHAKCTVFGEGSRGSLAKTLYKKLNLQNPINPMTYEVGIKEVFQMPKGSLSSGRVIHTLGFPLKNDCVGGSWIYNMGDDMLSIGLVVPCDARDPFMDPHREMQRWKLHPFMKKILSGGQLTHYGAKTITAGGYYSIPQLTFDGGLFVGEAASFVNMSRLKGIHLAMKSGMIAGELLAECLIKGDFSAAALQPYRERCEASYIYRELWKSRNFHQALSKGLLPGLFHVGLQEISGGRGLIDPMRVSDDHKHMQRVATYHGNANAKPEDFKYDGSYTKNKVEAIYLSGTIHEEHQPSHLKIANTDICFDVCQKQYESPCNRFCPANVYELMVTLPDGQVVSGTDTQKTVLPAPAGSKFRMQLNFSNCVHCKTCDIMCPHGNITWTTPEGGGGPRYSMQ